MKYIYYYILICIAFVSCKEEEPQPNFNRQNLLNNIAYNIVIPPIEEGINSCQDLLESVNDLQINPSYDQLLLSRESWKLLAFSWKAIEIMNIGTIKSSYIHSKIGRWPSNISNINELCLEPNLTIETVNSTGAANKGLFAIEYLLYSEDILTNTGKLNLVQIETIALEQALIDLLELWNGTDGYAVEFTSNLNINLYSPYASYINAIVQSIDYVYKERLGKPMGKFNGSEIIAPEIVEHPYSEISLRAITRTLRACLQLYKGDENLGADDELIFIDGNTRLSEQIENQFQSCIDISSGLTFSLKEALENNYSELENLYEELKLLRVVLKNELSSKLSVIIILSDTDGD